MTPSKAYNSSNTEVKVSFERGKIAVENSNMFLVKISNNLEKSEIRKKISMNKLKCCEKQING